ncbi:LOW QUALITY PROTEIN: Helitron helicase [Phytophthora megakarya]|uniref:ATP-dependent DNA helicase n=1 Tax=Phytophthora megakarya TaxID=4795 RepID=A0A225WCM6_9STRA|nr:LOW QUALITY PROTEIN: Helitron helicase [Phytophthora megakarya]
MHKDEEPFGGKVFALSGDFRQFLPVVKKGTPADTTDACLKSSTLWPHFQQVHLTENMRVRTAENSSTAEEMREFSDFLLQVGEGRHEGHLVLGKEYMKLPGNTVIPNPVGDPDEDEEIVLGAIPKGMTRLIDHINCDGRVLRQSDHLDNNQRSGSQNQCSCCGSLTDEAREYLSTDSVEDAVNGDFFEPKVLHAVNLNGNPPHKLMLKKGIPIMMMRNLNPDLGPCNGTRLRIEDLKDHVTHATIMTGERKGQHVLFPRIVFISDNDASDIPFRLRRKAFPVQSAFAVPSTKPKAKRFSTSGCIWQLHASRMLYVALSRVSERSSFKALIENAKEEEDGGVYTENIVYRQIFE